MDSELETMIEVLEDDTTAALTPVVVMQDNN